MKITRGGSLPWMQEVGIQDQCVNKDLNTLLIALYVEDHGARTPAGVFTRVAQRLLALAAGIWHNWTTGITSKRSLIAFDH